MGGETDGSGEEGIRMRAGEGRVVECRYDTGRGACR